MKDGGYERLRIVKNNLSPKYHIINRKSDSTRS